MKRTRDPEHHERDDDDEHSTGGTLPARPPVPQAGARLLPGPAGGVGPARGPAQPEPVQRHAERASSCRTPRTHRPGRAALRRARPAAGSRPSAAARDGPRSLAATSRIALQTSSFDTRRSPLARLGLVGEDPGRASAGARFGRRGGPRPAHAHEQPAVRAAQRLRRPVLPAPRSISRWQWGQYASPSPFLVRFGARTRMLDLFARSRAPQTELPVRPGQTRATGHK